MSKGEIHEAGNQSRNNLNQDSLPTTDQEIRDMIDSLREVYLVRELKLSEDRANRILEKMRSARKIRQNYLFQRYRIEHELDALLEYPSPDQKRITAVLQELEVAKTQYYQWMMEADHELRTMLSLEEQAKYLLFQRNFNKKLREMIASIRQQSPKTPSKQNFLLRKQDDESVIRQPR
jgi:hypothetical protein